MFVSLDETLCPPRLPAFQGTAGFAFNHTYGDLRRAMLWLMLSA
jgi:hypothetical protein